MATLPEKNRIDVVELTDEFYIVNAEGTVEYRAPIGAVINHIDLTGKADKNNVLELDNEESFSPLADYHPATKKYVDENSVVDYILPTGVVTPDNSSCLATINADPTKFDLPAITYLINGEYYSYQGMSAIDPGYSILSNVVLVGLDENGLVLIDEIAYGQSEWKDADLDTIVPVTRLQAAAGETGPDSPISQLRADHYNVQKFFTRERIFHQASTGIVYDLAPNSGKIVRSAVQGQISQNAGRFFDLQRKPVVLGAIDNLIAVQFTGLSNPLVVIAVPWIAYDKYSAEFGVSLTSNSVSFSSPDIITDGGAGFLTAGFKVGDILHISGSSLNNGSVFEIETVSDDVITTTASSPNFSNEAMGLNITITTYLRQINEGNYACHFVMRPSGEHSNYFIKLSPRQFSTRDEAVMCEFDFGAFATAQVSPVARVIMRFGNRDIDTIVDERSFVSRQRPVAISQGVTNLADFANGSFLEKPRFRVESDGLEIIAYVDNATGDALNVQFNGLNYLLDVSVPMSVTLAEGTDTVPLKNYVYYVLNDDIPVLVANSLNFPRDEHARIGTAFLKTATATFTEGPLGVHAHTDHISQHLQHMNARFRREPAVYESGLEGITTIISLPTKDDVYLSNFEGYATQMHEGHYVPVLDMQIGVLCIVTNHPTTPFKATNNLNTELVDAEGGGLDTRRFNLIEFIVASEDAGVVDSKRYINLPTGSDSNDQDAIDDVNNYAVRTIPEGLRGIAILTRRITFRHQQLGQNETWTVLAEEDLRGS